MNMRFGGFPFNPGSNKVNRQKQAFHTRVPTRKSLTADANKLFEEMKARARTLEEFLRMCEEILKRPLTDSERQKLIELYERPLTPGDIGLD